MNEDRRAPIGAREWVVRALVRHEDLEDELLRLTDAGFEVVEFLPVHPADAQIMPGLVTLVCRKRLHDPWREESLLPRESRYER